MVQIHYANRLRLTQATFNRIERLSSLGGRLTPYSVRRMVKVIIIPTLMYGAEFLDPSATIKYNIRKKMIAQDA